MLFTEIDTIVIDNLNMRCVDMSELNRMVDSHQDHQNISFNVLDVRHKGWDFFA